MRRFSAHENGRVVDAYEHHPVDDMEPDTSVAPEEIAEAFGRVLEWASRANSLVAMGQRMYVMLYALRPALIEGMTLEQIGKQNATTRQNIDKLVCDFRDTFGGIRSGNDRGESARVNSTKTDSQRNFTKKPIENI